MFQLLDIGEQPVGSKEAKRRKRQAGTSLNDPHLLLYALVRRGLAYMRRTDFRLLCVYPCFTSLTNLISFCNYSHDSLPVFTFGFTFRHGYAG